MKENEFQLGGPNGTGGVGWGSTRGYRKKRSREQFTRTTDRTLRSMIRNDALLALLAQDRRTKLHKERKNCHDKDLRYSGTIWGEFTVKLHQASCKGDTQRVRKIP